MQLSSTQVKLSTTFQTSKTEFLKSTGDINRYHLETPLQGSSHAAKAKRHQQFVSSKLLDLLSLENLAIPQEMTVINLKSIYLLVSR